MSDIADKAEIATLKARIKELEAVFRHYAEAVAEECDEETFECIGANFNARTKPLAALLPKEGK